MNKKAEREDWLRHESLWKSSGLSQRQYSQSANLCPRRFNYHLKRLNKEGSVSSDFKFIGVKGGALEKNALKDARGGFKIELPNGVSVVVSLSSGMSLAEVISAAGAVRC